MCIVAVLYNSQYDKKRLVRKYKRESLRFESEMATSIPMLQLDTENENEKKMKICEF